MKVLPLLLLLSLGSMVYGTTYTNVASQDASVSNGGSCNNLGGAIDLKVTRQNTLFGPIVIDSYIEVPLTGIPLSITSAHLRVYLNQTLGVDKKFRTWTTSTFNEFQITGSPTGSCPYGPPADITQIGDTTVTSPGNYDIDVTSTTQTALSSGASVVDFHLGVPSSFGTKTFLIFNSREQTSNKPSLIVVA